jgi:hypothetical protein
MPNTHVTVTEEASVFVLIWQWLEITSLCFCKGSHSTKACSKFLEQVEFLL